jgi:hypothetical protein
MFWNDGLTNALFGSRRTSVGPFAECGIRYHFLSNNLIDSAPPDRRNQTAIAIEANHAGTARTSPLVLNSRPVALRQRPGASPRHACVVIRSRKESSVVTKPRQVICDAAIDTVNVA